MAAVSALTSRTAAIGRRRCCRYSITAVAQLRLFGSETRAGAIIHNISSRGVFFSAEIDLDEGELVELLIDWPVPLDDRIPLTLWLAGTVCRKDLAGIAMIIRRYDWKIRTASIGRGVESGEKASQETENANRLLYNKHVAPQRPRRNYAPHSHQNQNREC